MYSRRIGFVLGFHGCDKEIRDRVVSEKGFLLKDSKNNYDWLGNGAYFWENNHERALQYAIDLMNNPPKGKKNLIKEPAVLGAIIDLGHCLDLIDSKYLNVVKSSYEYLCQSSVKHGLSLPENKISESGDLLIRKLDCAVIEATHELNEELKRPHYDSVRGVFFEGNDLYKNAGFKEKNHIQIAIRNQDCIKGFFIPRI